MTIEPEYTAIVNRWQGPKSSSKSPNLRRSPFALDKRKHCKSPRLKRASRDRMFEWAPHSILYKKRPHAIASTGKK